MTRYFKTDAGWLVDTFGGAALEIDVQSHIASVAARHGFAPDVIEVIESEDEDDPRKGDLIYPRPEVRDDQEPVLTTEDVSALKAFIAERNTLEGK